MRTIRIAAAGCMLLLLPVVGSVQQAPNAMRTPPEGVAELKELMSAQTALIKALKGRVEALEERVKVLEESRSRAAGDSR
jgi:hypothetical protein